MPSFSPLRRRHTRTVEAETCAGWPGNGQHRRRYCQRMTPEAPAEAPHSRAVDSGVRLAELMAALSIATDLGMGQPLETALSSCVVAIRLGEILGLDADTMRDVSCPVEEVIAEGDRVAGRFSLRGTHRGTLLGVPPTGNPVGVGVMVIARFDAAGKWVEDWVTWDQVGLFQQLGVIPTPAAA
jgi:SnoaL-like polyketide cyclase